MKYYLLSAFLLFLTLPLSADEAAPIPPPADDPAPDILSEPESGEDSEEREESGVPAVLDPASLLGMTLKEAYSAFGIPLDVFVQRGEQAWQDDVVFYYAEHLYLFWYESRVWQVRLDSRSVMEFYGLKMGSHRSSVFSQLGKPLKDEGSRVVISLEDRGFPVRARCVFENDRLTDLYIYRGDF